MGSRYRQLHAASTSARATETSASASPIAMAAATSSDSPSCSRSLAFAFECFGCAGEIFRLCCFDFRMVKAHRETSRPQA